MITSTWRRLVRTRTLFALGYVTSISSPATAGRVALTFDDLPVFGKFVTAADGADVTDELLVGMARHHWKATGFVNEIQLDAADRP